jgi:hypothetical protein
MGGVIMLYPYAYRRNEGSALAGFVLLVVQMTWVACGVYVLLHS